MTSAFSFHALYDAIDHDPNPLRMAIASLQPRVINIVGGARKTQAFSFAIELLKKYPDMRVIFRNMPDDGNHAKDRYALKWHRDVFGNLIIDDYSGCDRWIEDNQNYLLAGLTVLTDNESVNDNMHVYAAWQARIMDMCGAKGWRVAVGRFAVGNPRESDYARMKVMWEALAKWHPLHTWSPNEYIPQDIKDASGMINRYTLGIDAAKNIGAWPFDISIGEYGVVYRKPDGGLDADAGFSDPRIGWSGERAFQYLYDQWVKWYKSNSVDVCVYCWGDDSANKWSRFRVDNNDAFIKALTTANNRGELEPVTTQPLTPNYTPVDKFEAGKRYKVSSPGAVRNIRESASISSKRLGAVSDNETVTALEEKVVGVDYWWKISTPTVTGWISLDGNTVKMMRQPDVVVVTPPAPYVEVTAEYAAKLAENCRKSAAAKRQVASSLLASNNAIDAQMQALAAVKVSNVLRAQDIESEAQLEAEQAAYWENVYQQTKAA